MVSDWARTKNLSFKKAREELLSRQESFASGEDLKKGVAKVNRRFSKSFINYTMEQPLNDQ